MGFAKILLFFFLFSFGKNYEKIFYFLKTHQFDSSIFYLNNCLFQNPRDSFAFLYLGKSYLFKKDYKKAREIFKEAKNIFPNFDSLIYYYYYSSFKLVENNKEELNNLKVRIKNYLDTLLLNPTEKNLSFAYLLAAFSDTIYLKRIRDEILEKYPESKIGYEIIGNIFYDSLYPIWYNDTLKIDYLKRFLERFKKSEWRFNAYQFLLSSFYNLKDLDNLIFYCEEMVKEMEKDVRALNFVASLYLRCETLFDKALNYSLKSLKIVKDFKKPKHLPIEQWELIYPKLYPDACFNIARSYFYLKDYKKANRYIKKALKIEFDLDNDATKAPYHYFSGLIKEKMGRIDEAIKDYGKTLILGDVNNFYSQKAESSLKRIFGDKIDLITYLRKIFKYQGPIFTDITKEVGLEEERAGRVAFGDYNNDGYEDLLLNGSKLFKNENGERFVEVTKEAGIYGNNNGGLFADLNNDGYLDIVCISNEKKGEKVFKNNGDGTFTDMSEIAKIYDDYPSEGLGIGDIDNDGLLDIYIANYEIWEEHKYLPDFLYRNLGDFKFEDISEKAGIRNIENKAGRGINFGDYNNDGYLDIYVSNYRLCENFLWHNNKNLSFENKAHYLGIAGDEREGYYGHTIGSEWADYDNDGDLDLITANLAHPRYIQFSNRTMLYENKGNRFIDVRKKKGIKYEETHSDPAFGDIDNDGDLDLYITSVYENRRSFLYLNDKGKFKDITYLSGVRVFNGWGCAFSDFDNDGDLDLIVGSGSGTKFFRNDTENNNYLKIKMIGKKSNKNGIGARVKIKIGKKILLREVNCGKGTTSQSSMILHFGLGKKNKINLNYRFLGGKEKTLKNIKANQLLIIEED
ncbi:MAG: FG-GAP-like repeat-containing protein [candidate division WOR-3 bacterium]|nr:FG-GAP-like repeat-containing protein [candidate division WOR-3 bacterium]